MEGSVREWTAGADTVPGPRLLMFIRLLCLLYCLGAVWTLWLYFTGDVHVGEALFRVLLAISFIFALRTPRPFTVKASTEALFLSGPFRLRRVPWPEVAEVRLDTPKSWTTAVLVTTSDGKTLKAPVVNDVESLLEYWNEVQDGRTDA